MIDIFIRQTTDWENMNEQKFLSQSFNNTKVYWHNLILKIKNYIKIWENFSISYFMYRKYLKDIAVQNLLSTKCNIILNSNYFKERSHNPLFIAIDDDDWLHPRISNELLEFVDKKNVDIIIWNHTILESDGELSLENNKKCFTNNFALTKSGINKLINVKTGSADGYLVANSPFLPHYDIHRRIIKKDFETGEQVFNKLKKDNFNIVHLNKRLSISNKSLASASLIDKIEENEYFLKIKKLSKLKVPNALWAKEEINLLNNLNKKVKFKLKYL
jgi:hypothetical protein